jgi:hypothetical protein
MRKLLPYEHQLIEELGITQEEYLDFLAVQFDYSTTPAQRLQTPQGEAATVALVLTIIGILFQVASMLLMPKPSAGGRRQTREQQFAPRFGFNGNQELAKYGDPLNLVYCNTAQNSSGGVRVATSLIWSAVSSFGSSQFMQMLLAVGAAEITQLDYTRTAFGQTPLRNFISNKVWAYYAATGNMKFGSALAQGDTTDPSRIGAGANDFVYRANLAGKLVDGFSQAFSPSTLTTFGVYAPIPIYVNVEDRAPSGAIKSTLIGITMDLSFRSTYWPSRNDNGGRFLRPTVPIGTRFTLTFEKGYISDNDKVEVKQTASENRRAMLSGIDPASVYKLGSAKYKLVNLTTSDLDSPQNSSDALATFECVETGICPEEDYETNDFNQNKQDASDQVLALQVRNVVLQDNLLRNDAIYILPSISVTNVEAQLVAKLDLINAKEAALVDYTETNNAYQNFSDIETSYLYPSEINVLIEDINKDELKLEDLRVDNIKDKRQAKEINTYVNSIKRKEKLLRRLFIDFYGRNYKDTLKRLKKEIEQLRKEMAAISASNVSASNGGRDTDAETRRNNAWQAEINSNNATIAYLQAVIADPEQWNDYFNMKALTKIEEAAYETITNAQVIKFSIKAQVFKRISGRSRKYGEKTEPTYKSSDNGVKMRSAFFWFRYRKVGEASFKQLPYIFTIRRGADFDNYVDLSFVAPNNTSKWQFKFEPIADTAAEVRKNGSVQFAYIENSGSLVTPITGVDGAQVVFSGSIQSPAGGGYLPPINNNPSQTDEWGLFSLQSDTNIQFSFDNGPEMQIKAVTEQQIEPFSNYPGLYKNMSLFGFNAYSGQNIQDLRSVTVFATQGKKVRKLNNDGTYSATPDTATSYAPEVFLDTILDPTDGIGQYAKVEGIDLAALAKAKRFCETNRLFFDGVIADMTPWRQFWSEVAPFSLLELGRIGGKETLVPALPCDEAGNITRTLPISAMFTPGNILEGTYKEEFIDYGTSVQDLIASVIYRSTEENETFPRNRSVDVSIKGVTETTGVRQTFDVSAYVTNQDQAIKFAKLLCNQRRHIRKAIEFSTFPTNSRVGPGEYIYVDIGQNNWQGIYSGQVEPGGILNTPITNTVPDGTYTVLLYKSDSAVVTLSSVAISGNVASAMAGYTGYLFVLGTPVKSKRVFRITEVQMDEEGEISVRAIEHPCDSNGQSLIADLSDSLFTIVR